MEQRVLKRKGTNVDYRILKRDELPRDGNTSEFEGNQQGAPFSFIWVGMPPGDGVRLHRHAYQEVFVIQEGVATFLIDSTTLEVQARSIVIVPPSVPHKFTNTGERRLRQIDIHQSPQIVTEWLED